MSDTLQIYTDGSCLNNPGPGGWAFCVVSGGKDVSSGYGSSADTTNNRMELQAAIEGLKAQPLGASFEIVSDSNYVIKGITEWIHGWLKRGWKNASKKPVENRDLWEELHALNCERHVQWTWVKAHAGNTWNEHVDTLARDAAISQSSS